MRFGSVCDGVSCGAAAWVPLGWTFAWRAEIEPFADAVAAARWPGVPNLGDFTRIARDVECEPIDLLSGGTPCQSFSVAGLRGGLDDERGNLSLEFLKLAGRLRPCWLVWENVAGVLSSLSHAAPDPSPPPDPLDLGRDGQEVETEDSYNAEELHALHCFLAGLEELGYGWAYRVLDAQHFGVPQQRRRVILVGYLGDWRPAAEVLFEPASLSGDSPSRGKAGEDLAGTLGGGSGSRGWAPDTERMTFVPEVADCLTATMGSRVKSSHGRPHNMVAHSLLAKSNDSQDPTKQTYVAHSLRGEGFDASEDGTGRGTPIVPMAFGGNNTSGPIDVATAVNAHGGPHGRCDFESETFIATPPVPILEAGARTGTSTEDPKYGIGIGAPGDPMYALQAGKQHAVAVNARQDPESWDDQIGALDRDGNSYAVAFTCKDHGAAAGAISPTLRAMGHDKSHANAGGQVAVAITENQKAELRATDTVNSLGRGGGKPGQGYPAVAVSLRGREGGGTAEVSGEQAPALRASGGGGDKSHALVGDGEVFAVRRLTPLECERLQGLPDNYTRIAWRGKPAEECPDGPRYRAIGNGWAVPVFAWVGQRIAAVADRNRKP